MIRLIDTTLRDGMHAVSHQLTPDQMAAIAAQLDTAGVYMMEVGHGDGLGGSSFQYGFAKAHELEYFKAVSKVLTKSKLGALLIPGIGTIEDLEAAMECGVNTVRVATHVTEADTGEQHIKFAKAHGLETIGFLMMSHMAEPEKILEQAKLFEGYGADVVYITDSAGALLPEGVKARISLVKENLSIPVGFHAHNNLGLAVGNTLAALDAGASYVDGTLAGMGAGAGNAPLEVFIAAADKLGWQHGTDLYALMDAADDLVRPLQDRPVRVDRETLALGYAGVYSSFLRHCEVAAARYGLSAVDILVELGKRRMVGGQEDMIVDVALDLRNRK